MARYKRIDTSPRFLAVDLQQQLLPGTFEHAMNYLIDHELDLSGFERGPILWTGKLMIFYQLARRIHETHPTPYFYGRIQT